MTPDIQPTEYRPKGTELTTNRCPQLTASDILASARLSGKRVAMVTFSCYPYDVRPRRAAEALAREGMSLEVICLGGEREPRREACNGIDVTRVSIRRVRGGKISYIWQYSAFIFVSALILGLRSARYRYDLVYVHNMPDTLVLSAVVPKALGARVILDMHDPMPELMQAIFKANDRSAAVRLMKALERWSIAFCDRVVTVNTACKRIFSSRSCRPEMISVVMNSPDTELFHFRRAQASTPAARNYNQPFVIMYHGSLVERNGLNIAVSALEKTRQNIPRAELRIYGARTPFLDSVLATVREKGLGDAVHYLGARRPEELPSEIAKCDVGVIPNQRNAFTEINTPTRIFEYLSQGKPAIIPRTRGIQDYFDKECALFFEPGDPDDLARGIRYVASHPAEAASIVERGQRIYLKHTWPDEKRCLIDTVADVLA